MACSCQKNRQQYEVVAAGGKVVFTTGSKPTADSVAKRYPGSEVREKAKAGATTAAK
ncbi:hypothetical protein ACFVT1_36335 [Streptomyces sp. NPDC057963]|uniref:hypothetical protein n=1 Tax=Streptomyces sp. NPDC057963 TaxID=3346290 RepID=UPI0036E022DD